ncbi:ubiquitin family protein [Sporobolomyces salmoneus]|uniref:ubiquitin family protein n=1 Tax=Sporobolomyces salmoneus TaxID=183962 RepID=UPI003174FD19
MQLPIITITVKTMKGENIKELKAVIEEYEGVPICQQQSVFNLQEALLDDRTAISYGITKDTTLHMILKLCGCACGCRQIPWVISMEVDGVASGHARPEVTCEA